MPQSGIAGGDVYPMRFVKLSTTADGKVLAAGAGDVTIGISQRGTRRSEYVDTSGKAAASGEPVQYFDETEECILEAGGTIAAGDKLKSDSNGKGVATTTDKDWMGAIALQAGASGDLLKVKVQGLYLSV